ncbi:hypothetical protein [Klebsiella grimontii]|uniref:Uncharacterized protein n=1 Tax=Thelohanellus kitauei TaxID=669202 RepID=A0A0C2MI73_THEKT|nr:hypothetical protein [Klebsiella grimontii]KII64080.1 hypothetical protein RF11_01177 [Thelohanellus kitauei]HDH7817940.1 hypothetical protein [Raoultella ornithinolytica]HDT5148008.1 hypothetical protein [Klebsiella michiganensis]MBZ7675342.1 hypothetical protein [Klebsiella grimontii]HDX8749662.1 hypothetical protein [Klebsiella michiganensis]
MVDSTTVNGNPDSQPPQLNWNALFRGDHARGGYNACVGNNGSPDLYYYADGFADSVDLLIEALTAGHSAQLDTLIYPICFSLRHSVELTIKGQIKDLSQLAKRRNQPLAPDTDIEKELNQHDIMNLWIFFSVHAAAFDRRYKEKVSALEPLIRCIGETDPTGQTFRYSYSAEAKKHLTDVSVINVLVLREQFCVIREQLEELTGLTHWLWREYSTGIFTKTLSRKDLQAIAVQLPPRQSWSDPSAGLDGIRSCIKSEYNIGSKELTEAFSKIQNSRDLARIIGVPVNIPGLSIVDLNTLNDVWKMVWDRDALVDELRKDISGVTASPIIPVNLLQDTKREILMQKDTKASFAQFMQWATKERLAGLLALMDARDYRFSEEHDSSYEYYKDELTAAFSGSPQARDAEISEIWFHSIARRNYPSRIIDYLKVTGFAHESAALEENLFS